MTETIANSSPQLLSGLICDWLEFSVLLPNRISVEESNVKKQKISIGDAMPNATRFTYRESHEREERRRISNLLHKAIEEGKKEHDLDTLAAAEIMESCLFANYFYQHEPVYYLKARMLCENLAKNGEYLLKHYDPEILCYFPSEALASGTALEEWRDNYKYMLQQKLFAIKSTRRGLFECQHCHSKNTDSFESQTRSADEPATIFINCFDCGRHFRR